MRLGRVLAAGALAFLASEVVAQTAPVPETELDTKADWLEIPSADVTASMWPPAARQQKVGGRAVSECVVNVAGLLERCSTVSESPPGLGFGAAAIRLSPLYRFKPATRDGVSVPSIVRIPINFHKVDARRGATTSRSKVTVVSQPVFSSEPTRDEIAAVHPAAAKRAGLGGLVLLDCGLLPDGALSRCMTSSEQPAGQGFSAAARFLAPKYRLAPESLPRDKVGIRRPRVLVRVLFEALVQVGDAGAQP